MDRYNVSLIDSTKKHPVPLTNPSGDWLEDTTLMQNWCISEQHSAIKAARQLTSLLSKERAHDLARIPGDPRNLTYGQQSVVAMKSGVLGILTITELDAVKDCGQNPNAYTYETLVTPADFSRILTYWQAALRPLISVYPHTYFFVAHGEPTFMGRMTLNAFTPLHNGVVAGHRIAQPDQWFTLSPYSAKEAKPSITDCTWLSGIATVLDDLSVEPGLTAWEAAADAGCPHARSMCENKALLAAHRRELDVLLPKLTTATHAA